MVLTPKPILNVQVDKTIRLLPRENGACVRERFRARAPMIFATFLKLYEEIIIF